ncbi:polysaccharide deacetylase family protein [Paenibacillus sp. J2TS4]|uniref:polysaccharide deacetylase family protein n=1 Tax=Paenibacillus sp. J2TS4 TaxID=2807194 RepID=UPI001AFF4127|nr:polysaccharide deacetylase family protein [Paenibacillus sp. J2TS4]GIP33019.1 hypothetical protein J2TS4_22290 [Paenibacillus sp. J2TS4]
MKRCRLHMISIGLLLTLVIAGCDSGQEKGNGQTEPFAESLWSEVQRQSDLAEQAPRPAPLPSVSPSASTEDSGPSPIPASDPPATSPEVTPPQPAEATPAPPPAPKPAAKGNESNHPKRKQVKSDSKPVKPSSSSSQLTLSELRAKYPQSFRLQGSSRGKKIALTFDDGPDQRFTPQILEILKKNNVKATFFLLGYRAEANPNVVKRIAKEGHAIGNHSYNHPNFPNLPLTVFEQQMTRTQKILNRLIGYEPKLIRPPYGAINEEQLQWAIQNQFMIVNWNVDSLDWKGLSAKQVSANILNHAHSGAIILQHSAGGNGSNLTGTVEALQGIIEKLKADGYQFVTVPEMLNVPKAK